MNWDMDPPEGQQGQPAALWEVILLLVAIIVVLALVTIGGAMMGVPMQ